jgi:phosphoribosylanthranilate isomerase
MPRPARVKICGINDPAAYAAAATADWTGFVFFPPSPRYVTLAQAASLAQADGPAKVGLFVEPSDDDIATALQTIALDVLQVLATPERAAAIRTRFGRPVWRVVGVTSANDLPHDTGGIDGLLLDAQAPPDAKVPGGNATAFDWSILQGWTAPLPWLLAGGLTPDTVRDAIDRTGAPAVDVSSGVEASRGVKDPAKITAFIHAVRAA